MTINKTFALQTELAALPIPHLSSTKAKLLQWIKPLVSEEQFTKTASEIERFFELGGDAEQLQAKLHEWAESHAGSWLAPFWDASYLQQRDPLPYNVNFNILLKNDNYKDRFTTSELAGRVSFLVAELYHAIIDEEIEAEIIRGKLQDMSQYRKFFRSVRIPKRGMDEFHRAKFDKQNNHVVILYKNNVYKVQVTNNKGKIYPTLDIASVIERKVLTDQDEGINVGLFTTAHRDDAAKAYDMLKQSKKNADVLDTIADALVIISIDEESKESEETIRNMMLQADNKYFDKTIQIIITQQNELGFNIEHCKVDGTTISAVISYVSKGLKQDLPQHQQLFSKPTVEKKKWKLKKDLLELLTQFHKNHLQQTKKYYLQSKVFSNFGAEEIKKMRFSPDAFFHMALQIAQYRTFGKLRSVYEPVSIRSFWKGRTECARSTSMEKHQLVEALESSNEDVETIYALMQQASNAHSIRIRECQQGFGIERHMFALEQIYKLFGEELGIDEIPAIFQDTGYLTMCYDFISTSAMAYDNVKYRMFGPVVPDGYGVAYIILDDTITINISSFMENKNEGNLLMEHLLHALSELRMIANKRKDLTN